MAESFLSLFKCLKKQSYKEESKESKPISIRRGSQVKPTSSSKNEQQCAKCFDKIESSSAKQNQFSINIGSDSDPKQTRNGKQKTKDEQNLTVKENQIANDKEEEEGTICESCKDKENQNTDAMSQSAVSASTAYGSTNFYKSNKNTRERRIERGDADGGEPATSKRSSIEREFQNRPFRKYVFLPGHKAMHPMGTFSNKEDEAMYHALKSNKDVETYKENGLSFNVINSKWILNWHNYINQTPGSKHPGRINNLPIAQQIMDFRLNKKHALHDNSVPLREPKDVYVLSHTFFKGFSERYGVDVEIKMVKYKSIQDILD